MQDSNLDFKSLYPSPFIVYDIQLPEEQPNLIWSEESARKIVQEGRNDVKRKMLEDPEFAREVKLWERIQREQEEKRHKRTTR